MVKEVIRINAETHEAWTLLASIFKELGDVEKAVTSLLCAAHLRPKDIGGWLNCARFAMEDTSDLRSKHLNTAKICYSSALRVNSKDLEARCGKATVLREMGFTSTAISQYRQALLQKPHDTLILRQLAEAYIDEDQAEAAIELYQQSIAFYRNLGNAGVETFGWSDLNIYVELYAYLGQYKSALWELRSLARWILGREQESWWDEVQDDDREWDEDDSRRIKEQRYTPGLAEAQRYGAGLPLELRVKLGVYRLRLQNLDEAMVSLPGRPMFLVNVSTVTLQLA
jgi:general transcription factor 3C polypeptide 3 (transcription factor C subunit 4)